MRGSEYVVGPSGSCAATLRVFYLELFSEDPKLLEEAKALAAKTYEFSEFLVKVLKVEDAATFGATHLGAIYFIARTVPPALSATAQSLYSAAVMGLGLGLAILASGSLYAAFGGRAYFAMAVLSALGSVLAVILARRVKA